VILGVAAIALFLFLFVGCGGDAKSTTPASRLVDGCLRLGTDTRAIHIRISGSFAVEGAVVGRGRAGVVLANQSDRNLCSWLSFARVLTRAGFRVLLFDYSGVDPQADVAAAAKDLHQLGASSVALMGASKGARAVLVAGSLRGVDASAVISLSAESTGRTGPPRIAPFVRRLRVPILFVAARHDPWTGDGRDTHELYRAARASSRRLVEVPGDAHGVELLEGARGKRVSGLVIAFLRRVAELRSQTTVVAAPT
jgi:pimeloyl-ACP methyl ester carboxylesterase